MVLEKWIDEEIVLKEVWRCEQKEVYFYMMVKVLINDIFKNYGGIDMCVFDVNLEIDFVVFWQYCICCVMLVQDFVV